MANIDYFSLPWKDQWEWETSNLPTVTRKFFENSEKYADKDFQQFNPALYNGDSSGSMT